MTNHLKLISRLGERLAAMGKTQGWLSRKLGMTRQQVSSYVRGAHPSLFTAYKIAGALNCTIEDLWIPAEEDES